MVHRMQRAVGAVGVQKTVLGGGATVEVIANDLPLGIYFIWYHN